MPVQVSRPGRGTKGGQRRSTTSGAKQIENIYDVQDSDWDLLDIALDQISANPFNERAMGDLEELAADIADKGLDTPVTVMHTEKFIEYWEPRFPDKVAELKSKTGEPKTKFILGYGERRWRASVLASKSTGVSTIRGHLRNGVIPEVRRLLIRENYHRLDPTPLERARHIKALVDEEGLSYAEVCETLNIKSKGSVSKLRSLLDLPELVQLALEQEQISQKTALALGELDHSRAEAALELIVGRGMKPDAAVYHVRTATTPAVSPGNGAVAAEEAAPNEDAASEVGFRPEAAADKRPEATENIDQVSDNKEASKEEAVAPSSTSSTQSRVRVPTAPVSRDTTAADRAEAAHAREIACVKWLSVAELPSAEQRAAMMQRALLAGGKTDRVRAHTWLVRANKAHFDIRDVEGYFVAVLSSNDEQLIDRATWAIALASNEMRAGDRRRPVWDAHDAAYIQDLMTIGYVPRTTWERAELTRLGVSLGNDPEHTDQESA